MNEDGFSSVKTTTSLPTGDFREREAAARKAFVRDMVGYVQTHPRYAELNKEEVAAAIIEVLLADMGAANDFLKAIGVDLDLYTYDFSGTTEADDGLLRCTFERNEMEVGPVNKAHYIETKLLSRGFDLKSPMRRDYDIDKDLVIYTQRKEVSNADRAERTPEGSDQAALKWEDPVRGSRER